MKMSRRVVLFILCVLFAAAIAARVSTRDPNNNPYFRGASAMSYRHMLEVADHHSLGAHDSKAAFPQGYVPDRYRAAGAETLTGLGYRAVRLVSDMDGRDFARRAIIVMASLCVFTVYGAASQLWNSQRAGFLGAFLVAFEPALVSATNGRVFSHAIFAAFFASLYAAVALRALKESSRSGAALAALLAFVLLWIWEPARYGLLAWVVPVSLMGSIERPRRVWFVISHAAVIAVAACMFPHLVATRALGAWTTAVAMGAVVAACLPPKQHQGWRPALFVLATGAVLTLALTPLRAGASEDFPALRYLLTRLQYIAGRPSSSLLSDWMRGLWSADHAPLAPRALIQLFLPVLLCAAAWLINREVRASRRRFLCTAIVLVVASLAAALDRSALAFAALPLIIVLSGAASALEWRRWSHSALVAASAYTALAGVVLAGKFVDPSHLIVRATHTGASDPASFSWISFENTDKSLIRFLSTRTSVQESILAPNDLSAVLLAFSGRTSVMLPGTTSRLATNRNVDLMRGFYRDEDSFYQLCQQEKVDYVLYSVDMLLDGGAYSPVYTSGISGLTPGAIAARMHFQPESLRHFTLLYENEHYRLFKVSDTAQPVFLTDHPLYYQSKLFMDSGGSFENFRQRVLWLMGNCASGMGARARGDLDKSRQLLDQCVRYAPSFTRARLELAYTFMDLGRYEHARDQIAAIIQYAPDDAATLYAAAYVEVQMQKPDEAKPYLLLLAQTGDATYTERAKSLQYYIDHKLPLKPGAPQQ
jgi:hypothetical protein